MKRAKEKQQMSCYFHPEERRAIQQVAEKLERSESQVVQFGVRAFSRLFKQDPEKAIQLASPQIQEC